MRQAAANKERQVCRSAGLQGCTGARRPSRLRALASGQSAAQTRRTPTRGARNRRIEEDEQPQRRFAFN
jgi:hypothetical protein